MPKILRRLTLTLCLILTLLFAGVAQADPMSFLNFSLGDSINSCIIHIVQMENTGQIKSYQVINQNQIGAEIQFEGTPAAMILTFDNGYLTSLMIICAPSSNLNRAFQRVIEDMKTLVNKFGSPTRVNQDVDSYMINNQTFTDIGFWEFDDGDELRIGIFNNKQKYSMYIVMLATDDIESAW